MHYELIIALLLAWLLDLAIGDPAWLPHPVVGFGKLISWFEHRLNKGKYRILKGAVVTILLDFIVFFATLYILKFLDNVSIFHFPFPIFHFILSVILIFYCLAGTTLIREVRAVFLALDRSLD